MKLAPTGIFRDHAGQIIRYKTKTEHVPGADIVRCYIDPHDVDEFTAFGSGKNRIEAIDSAIADWNLYDQQP